MKRLVLAGIAWLLFMTVAVAGPQANAPSNPPQLTLQDALDRARKNSTQFQAALTTAGLAREDRTQARDALLPTAGYNNSAIYTESPGLANKIRHKNIPPVIFLANNAVHEYISQGNFHEALDLAAVANYRKLAAAAAVARAQAQIASRGLVVTTVQNYYSVLASQHKLEAAKKNAGEGDWFLKTTQALEQGGEAAHADVIRADLQLRERQRQLKEAQLAFLNARLDFAVLIFPDFNDNFELVDDLHDASPLPTLAEVQQKAARNNPNLEAALASIDEAKYDVLVSRAGYLPAMSGDYFYGIDTPQFAANSVTPEGQRFSNLGSSAVGSINVPIWNWGTTQSRIKQAEFRREQAKLELSLTQRKLLAEIQSFYAEAETARDELAGLSRSAQLADDSLRLSLLRYKSGETTVLEVVDAQTTYSQLTAAYQDGAVRYRVALASLQTLTGTN